MFLWARNQDWIFILDGEGDMCPREIVLVTVLWVVDIEPIRS